MAVSPDMLRGEIITDPTGYPIQPADITSILTRTGFEDQRTERAAWWVVALSQKRGGWHPFTGADIQTFYREAGGRGILSLGGLVNPIDSWNRWKREQLDGGYLAKGETEAGIDGIPEHLIITDKKDEPNKLKVITYHPTTAFVEAVSMHAGVLQPA